MDLHDAVQPAAGLLHAGTATGVADRADLHLRGVYLHYDDDYTACVQQLGPERDPVRALGWIHRQ